MGKYSFFNKKKLIILLLKCTYVKNKTNKKSPARCSVFSDTVCSDVSSAVQVSGNFDPGFQLKQWSKESSLASTFHKFLLLQLL